MESVLLEGCLPTIFFLCFFTYDGNIKGNGSLTTTHLQQTTQKMHFRVFLFKKKNEKIDRITLNFSGMPAFLFDFHFLITKCNMLTNLLTTMLFD